MTKVSPVDAKNGGMTTKESLLLRLSGQNATGRRDWIRDELYKRVKDLREGKNCAAALNMRLPHNLLAAVKIKAKAEGMPYTRYIRLVLEQAVTRV